MAKPIPKHIEKLGKIWVLIHDGHYSISTLQEKRYEKARSLLLELVGKRDAVWIESGDNDIIILKDDIGTASIDQIKASIHLRIRDCFDDGLYISMYKSQRYRWRWERIVEDYNGKPLTENDKQFDKWEQIGRYVKDVSYQIEYGISRDKYKNKDEILEQLEHNSEFIEKRMEMLQG